MSDREKKLLLFLCGALFIIANFFLFSQIYAPKMQESQRREAKAESALNRGKLVMAQQEEWQKTRQWLASAEGAPTTYQKAISKLQSLASRSAKRRGLTVKREDPLPHIEGANYDRVRIRFRVNGTELQIQQWLLDIHRANQLQVITKFDLKPQKNDLTRADCEVEIEKWFVPQEV